MKHKKEIVRWSNCPDGTKVWTQYKGNSTWGTTLAPLWNPETKHIVDDEYSELRKAEADGKVIQSELCGMGWKDRDNLRFSNSPNRYRIKPEPIYYYEWEKLEGAHISVSKATTEDLDKAGWRRIESSKRTWNEN